MVVMVDNELKAESRLDMDAAITAAAISPIKPGIPYSAVNSKIIRFSLLNVLPWS